jgi:hypothetical protein
MSYLSYNYLRLNHIPQYVTVSSLMDIINVYIRYVEYIPIHTTISASKLSM